MSTIPEKHSCDLSRRSFTSRADVRGGISLDTGDDFFVWSDVSPAAAREVLKFIDKRFPKNTSIMRRRHDVPLTARPFPLSAPLRLPAFADMPGSKSDAAGDGPDD